MADPEVPEADAQEQAQPVQPTAPRPQPTIPLEASEADALEQAAEVPAPDPDELHGD